jgi:hypothetical protein
MTLLGVQSRATRTLAWLTRVGSASLPLGGPAVAFAAGETVYGFMSPRRSNETLVGRAHRFFVAANLGAGGVTCARQPGDQSDQVALGPPLGVASSRQETTLHRTFSELDLSLWKHRPRAAAHPQESVQ